MRPQMGHQVVPETDPETGHITGTVLAIPEIIVDGRSEGQVLEDLRIAIAMALQAPVIRAHWGCHAAIWNSRSPAPK